MIYKLIEMIINNCRKYNSTNIKVTAGCEIEVTAGCEAEVTQPSGFSNYIILLLL